MKTPQLPAEPFDPQLKAAMEEVKAILAKYDCAAMVVLQAKRHTEHLLHVTPTWSCMYLQDTPEGKAIRFKAKLKTGDDEEKERGRLSISMVMGFLDEANRMKDNFERLAILLGKYTEIEHVSRYHPGE